MPVLNIPLSLPKKLKTSQFDLNHPPDVWTLSEEDQVNFALQLMCSLNVDTVLKVNVNQLRAFIDDVRKGYLDNPYHSFAHAIDVAWVCQKFVEDFSASYYLEQADIVALMISALCHDVGHVHFPFSLVY